MRTSRLLATSAILLLAACQTPDTTHSKTKAAGPALGSFGIDTAQIDTAVRPGNDFYTYVNGKWLATTKIPADKSRYGAFQILQDKSEADVHALLEELVATTQSDPTLRKVADLYAAWMNEELIEKRNIEPLQPDLDRIAAVTTRANLLQLVGDIHMSGPFAFGIQPDPADTSRYMVFVGQSGLGMGRDYYLNEGEEYDDYRDAYRNYIRIILQLLGDDDANSSAAAVFDLETQLAREHWTPAQRRDVKATYNPVEREGLQALAPNIDWSIVLEASGLEDTQNFVVAETSAIAGGAALLDSLPLETWKKYLAFHRASDTANLLPDAFDEASFAFYGNTLRGIVQQRDRWRRGVALVDRNIGEGLGQAYVAKYFPPLHKARMDKLIYNLMAAFEMRLEQLEWMDEQTRSEALKKLATFEPRIGYPATWRDYSALQIEPDKLFESVQNAEEFEWRRQVARLHQTVARDEWFMTPPTVNAYYNPLMNQITFPAAILQPPFFDALADPAVNYGGIGAVIGHEIGHGFDDQGREFDETGSIRNWWTPATEEQFNAATAALGEQYSAYCPIPGDETTCINGELTMGENIGDLGGLEMAYTAYKLSLGGKEAPVIDGFTGDQRFFLSWAQIWRGKSRVDALRNQLLTNPHSPQMVRGQNPQRNIDAWYEAFNVTENDRMFIPPEERVRIW